MGWGDVWWAVLGGFLANVVFGAYVGSFSSLLPEMLADVGVPYSGGGWISSAFFGGYLLSQIPFAVLGWRFGQWKVIAAGLALYTLSHLAFATSSNWPTMLTTRFIQGFIGGAVFIPSLQLALAVHERRRSAATGFVASGFNVGTGLGAFYSFSASGMGADWQAGLTYSTLVFAAMIPVASVLTSFRRLEGPRPGGSSSFSADLGFYMLNLIHFVRLGVIIGLTTWMPAALAELYGVDGEYAAFLSSIFQLSGILALTMGGYLTDALGKVRVMAANFAALALVLALTPHVPEGLLTTVSAVLGFLVYLPTPAAFAILRDRYSLGGANVAAGYLNTSAAAGALVMPYILGLVHDWFLGFQTPFYLAALLYIILLAVVPAFMDSVRRVP